MKADFPIKLLHNVMPDALPWFIQACGVCFCALCFVSATDAADTHIHLVGKHGDLYFPAVRVGNRPRRSRSRVHRQ